MDLSPADLIVAEIPPDPSFILAAWRDENGEIQFRYTGATALTTANLLRQIAGDVVAKEHGARDNTLQ